MEAESFHPRNPRGSACRKGREFSSEKISPLLEAENKIWEEWTADEQQQYLTLTQKYRDALEKYLKTVF